MRARLSLPLLIFLSAFLWVFNFPAVLNVAYAHGDLTAKSRIADTSRAPLAPVDDHLKYHNKATRLHYGIEVFNIYQGNIIDTRADQLTTWKFRVDGGAWTSLTTASSPVKFYDATDPPCVGCVHNTVVTDITCGGSPCAFPRFVRSTGPPGDCIDSRHVESLRYHETTGAGAAAVRITLADRCTETEATVDVSQAADGADIELMIEQGAEHSSSDTTFVLNSLTGAAHIYIDGPRVQSIYPAIGSNSGSVTIGSVSGHGYTSAPITEVRLKKAGEADIVCGGFTFDFFALTNGNCNITNAKVGAWDVVVTNPNLKSHTLVGGFTVEAGQFNVDPTEPNHWAWSDVIGWIDMCDRDLTGNCRVNTTSPELTRYASSSAGFIALNCNNSLLNLTCSGPAGSWKVMHDSITHNLSGWAWSDTIGWVSFCGNAAGGSTWDIMTSTWVCPTITTYQVAISGDVFTGWAWNDVVGWISFNCSQAGRDTCGVVSYRTKTVQPIATPKGDLISSTFKMSDYGAAVNSIMWQGPNPPAGSAIEFQIATSDCANGATNPSGGCTSGGWGGASPNCSSQGGVNSCYIGPAGTTDAADVYALPLPNVPIAVSLKYHNNDKYLRYRIYLKKGGGVSPEIQDVIVNWSP